MSVISTPTGYTVRYDANVSGVVFSGTQRMPNMQQPSYVIWISGPGANSGVIQVQNTINGVIEYSGTDVCSGISYPINAIARGGAGGMVLIKDGFYPLFDSVRISGDNITLMGEGWQQTQLRASGVFPAIIIEGGSTFGKIQDLYLAHFQSGYSGIGLLTLNASGGNIVGWTFRDLFLNDFATKEGNGIVMQNTSGTAIYNSVFDRLHVEGCENAIFANSFGSGSVTFMNSNYFTNSYFNQNKRVLRVKNGILGAFDNNPFISCIYQGYAGTIDAFDYETENSGHSYYTVHSNVMVWDLTGTQLYARINTQTELQLYGCLPTYRISGVGMSGYGTGALSRTIRMDRFVTSEGVFIGSGNNSTTAYSFVHNVVNPPINIQVTPMTPQARTSLFDVSGGASNITVTYETAPTSGTVKLSWRAQT